MTKGSNDSIIRYDDFDFKRVCFKSPVKNEDKVYVCAASLDDGSGPPVFMQTPEMQVHHALLVPEKGSKKSTVDLKIEDDGFYQLMRYIDTHIIQHVFRNREAWFHKDMNMAAVEDCYRSPIQKGESGPVVRFKLNFVDNTHHTVVFDENKKIKDTLLLEGKPSVTAIVQLRGLIMNKGSINPDWVVHLLKKKKTPTTRPRFSDFSLNTSSSD